MELTLAFWNLVFHLTHISVHIIENKYSRTNVLKSIDKQVFLYYNIISRK